MFVTVLFYILPANHNLDVIMMQSDRLLAVGQYTLKRKSG